MQNKLPFTDAVDLEILMMGYAHFEGDFSLFKKTLKENSSHPLHIYPYEHLEKIFDFMEHHPEDVFSHLPPKAKQAVEESKSLLEKMQKNLHDNPDSIEAKVDELILYFGDDPYSLIDSLVMESKESLPFLLKALKNPRLNDPLYPGFGLCVPKIADALKGIQDPKAIPHLFEALLEQNNKNEDALLDALASFDQEARSFLIDKLEQRPFSLESTYAAKALNLLKNADVGLIAIDQLCDSEVIRHPALINYLILLLDHLPKEERASLLEQLLEETHFSDAHKKEIQLLI
jgi:hypothetical protein